MLCNPPRKEKNMYYETRIPIKKKKNSIVSVENTFLAHLKTNG